MTKETNEGELYSNVDEIKSIEKSHINLDVIVEIMEWNDNCMRTMLMMINKSMSVMRNQNKENKYKLINYKLIDEAARLGYFQIVK